MDQQQNVNAMPLSKPHIENVLPKLLEWLKQDLRVCLATLYQTNGTSPRPLGSQMAITEDGQWFGYLSGGCAEQAIADEGVKAIIQQQSRSVRYGLGSRYMDIQLPCGAGIDVWFEQRLSESLIEAVLDAQIKRKKTGIQFEINGALPSMARNKKPPMEAFQRYYLPSRRLYIIGAGPNVSSLSLLARNADYHVQVLTPDHNTLDDLRHIKLAAELLESQSQIDALSLDSFSAAVLMFHEHEREAKILPSLLKAELAYIGALGSERTHSARIQTLRDLGFDHEQCNRVHGPIGLDINAKTSTEIALSVLAELTQVFQSRADSMLTMNKAPQTT